MDQPPEDILSDLRGAVSRRTGRVQPRPPAPPLEPQHRACEAPGTDLFAARGPEAPPPMRSAPREKPRPKVQEKAASADILSGHRARLRARFDRGEALADYELLELALFRAIPRRDTKPIAKAMMATFGSFAGAVGAPAERLLEMDGIGERVVSDLRLIKAAAERFALAQMTARTALTSTDAVANYYMSRLRTLAVEEFHILFLDKKNQFIASECAAVGTVDHTPVYPREVVRRALAQDASAVVLIHNHPSGDPTPSRADVSLTTQIIEAFDPLGIRVHDHIIIGSAGYLSLRGAGYL